MEGSLNQTDKNWNKALCPSKYIFFFLYHFWNISHGLLCLNLHLELLTTIIVPTRGYQFQKAISLLLNWALVEIFSGGSNQTPILFPLPDFSPPLSDRSAISGIHACDSASQSEKFGQFYSPTESEDYLQKSGFHL